MVEKEKERIRGSYHEQRIKGRNWGKLGKEIENLYERGMRNIDRKSKSMGTWLVVVGGTY